ncbi:MAG: transcription termination factor NusA [Candidatus Marinimicrobia bacterium]|nr:transcription termination factor NusA [Candidatus Neomarinimicrobiota bacterium]
MINKNIIDAFSEVAKQKNIDRTNLNTIMEDLFMSMILKKYGEDCDNFSVIVNMDKGEIEIYQEKTIVKEVVDPVREISSVDALQVEPDLEIGDPFVEVIDPSTFGRRIINTAKQYLSHKIRDVESKSVYENFSKRIGEIVTGSIHQIQRDRIFINCENTELILPKNEQLPVDRYKRGESVRGVIKEVDYSSRGAEIILSRSDNRFLEQLFEMEIPEIEDGIIEIKNVSRVAGDRSKIVVYSSDRRIDAVGACVGMRGSRIQSIVRELNGEKIDIINWSELPEVLISRSLSPAKPINLYIEEDRPYAVAVFEDEELAVAIGKGGQNITLASAVSGYTIDAVKKSDYETKESIYLDEVKGITKSQLDILSRNNIDTAEDFLDADEDFLLSLKGFGAKTIEKIKGNIDN